MEITKYLSECTVGWVSHDLLRMAFTNGQIARALWEGHMYRASPGTELEDMDDSLFHVPEGEKYYIITM